MPRGFFEDPDFSKVFPTLKDEVLKITDNDKKFEISVDTHGYKPEELQVKVLDDVVTVEAKHEEKKSEENNKSFVSRQFSRYISMYYIISRTTRIYLDRRVLRPNIIPRPRVVFSWNFSTKVLCMSKKHTSLKNIYKLSKTNL